LVLDRPTFAAAAAILLGGLLALPASAGNREEPRDNEVSFHVERRSEVQNDRVTAILRVTDEDGDAARLAKRVNESMQWALDRARSAEGVRVKSGGYHTHPVTQKGKIQRWRASQDLILQSADVERTSALVGELQSRLQLASLGFSVSPERQRAAEDELIAEALKGFRARAEIVRESLTARGYEIVRISIDGAGRPPVMPMARAEMMSAQSAAPALEAGTQEVVVRVDGTIRLN